MSEVLIIENPTINNIISREVAEKELLSNDLIIAGGFPLSVLYYYLIVKEEFLPYFEQSITSVGLRSPFSLSYSDVDIWPTHKSLKNEKINLFLSPNFDSAYISKYGKGISYDKYNFLLKKQSVFANTFLRTANGKPSFIDSRLVKDDEVHRSLPFQFIKSLKNNPEELFEGFDLNICKVAWYNGKLYAHTDSVRDVKNKTLSLSEKYFHDKNETFDAKCYKSIRYLKYAKRYNLSLTKDLCDYISNAFIESSSKDIIDVINNDVTQAGSVATLLMSAEPCSKPSYDKKINKRRLYNSFVNYNSFVSLFLQENFDKSLILYLLDHPILHPVVKEIIEFNNIK